ncbi:MAG: hypothetical protein J7515_15435 [Caulobacter sp.]|nr:hypothetical protein [Caulobacter sp.]
MRLLATLGLFAFGAATSATAQVGTESSLTFPIVIDAPASTSAQQVASGGAVFVQAFRPAAAARLNAAYDVKGRQTVSFAEGAVFAAAKLAGADVYCAQGANRGGGVLVKGNAAVCLRDENHDGVFDGQMFIGSVGRSQTAFELNARAKTGWSPASVAYAQVGDADLPAGEIRIGYVYHKPAVGLTGAWAEMRVCAPKALSKSIDEALRCGALFEADKPNFYQERVWIDLGGSGDQTLTFGPIKTTVRVGANGQIDAESAVPLKSGPAMMFLAATYGPAMQPAASIPIYAIVPAGGT